MPDIEFFCRLRRYNAENFNMSRQICEDAKSKISAGLSRITPPAQLNEMVQYNSVVNSCRSFVRVLMSQLRVLTPKLVYLNWFEKV